MGHLSHMQDVTLYLYHTFFKIIVLDYLLGIVNYRREINLEKNNGVTGGTLQEVQAAGIYTNKTDYEVYNHVYDMFVRIEWVT